MPRIDAQLSVFEQQLLRSLAASRAQETLHALRVSTGKKVSKPSQDPAAFFQISQFESRLSEVDDAIDQVSAAGDFAAEAQLTVDLVRTQLDTIRELLLEDEDGGLSASERAANQLAIDDALEAINTLAQTRLGAGGLAFDGTRDYRVTGRDAAEVSRVNVYRTLSTTLSGEVTTTAQRATLTYTGVAGETTAAATITLTGSTGAVPVSVSLGQTLTSLAATINAESHNTGVTAQAVGNTLTFSSVEYGSAEIVDIDVNSGTFTVAGGDGNGHDTGVDAVAEINGQTITGEGNRVTYVDNSNHVVVEFAAGFSGTFDTLTIDADSAPQFALTTDLRHISRFGLRSLHTAELGGISGRLSDLASGGSLSGLDDNTSQAIRVVDEALAQIEVAQATADSFADITVASSSALLDDLKTTIEDTLTSLNGIDEDEENALIDYYESLSDNAISSLALLSQQRQSIVQLLRSLAGLG